MIEGTATDVIETVEIGETGEIGEIGEIGQREEESEGDQDHLTMARGPPAVNRR